jgi:hypothetical protein
MTILATGARQDGIESGGVRPLTRVERQAHDAFMHALAEGGVSRVQRGRAKELERSNSIRGINLRIDVFEDAKLTAGKGGAPKVA